MSNTGRFCPGCNEQFEVQRDRRLCPQCGHTLAAWGEAPTIDVADSHIYEAWQSGTCEEPDDELLGSELGTYRIEAYCGRGGMARVYRALHLTLRRLAGSRPEAIEAFLAEARAAAGLVHPNVVTIHTIGYERGLHYIEMEYVDGHSLAKVAERAGAVDLTRATRYMVDVSSALAAAHRFGLVHRDIKPANILVTADQVAKLADFGLAKRVLTGPSPDDDRPLTGTPYYMAPELFDGEPMGVTYFALCTGELPFVAKSLPQLAMLHAQAPLPSLVEACPHAPPEADAVIRRCLAKDPAERFADAEQLHTELRAVYGELRDFESLLREALEGSPVVIEGKGDRFEVTVALPGERTQRVLVEVSRCGAITPQIIRVFSICAPTAECYYVRALELNARLPHGAVAIDTVDGQPHFVMINSHPRASCDPQELRQSVLEVAYYADEVERQLTGRDLH